METDATIGMRCVCGSPDWFACAPGSQAQTTGDDPNVILLIPIPAVPTRIWCLACWRCRYPIQPPGKYDRRYDRAKRRRR